MPLRTESLIWFSETWSLSTYVNGDLHAMKFSASWKNFVSQTFSASEAPLSGTMPWKVSSLTEVLPTWCLSPRPTRLP